MKNSNLNHSNDLKFQKSVTFDAYRDMNKIVVVFNNWKKNKLLQQNMLKNNLEIEKEAAHLMTNIVYMNPQKNVLKDLYHMCNEMMNRNSSMSSHNMASKRETMKIIMNFTNMNRKSISGQSDHQGEVQNVNTSTARIKKNFSFSSSKNVNNDVNTISVHHSLQRDSKRNVDNMNSEDLLDYQAIVTGQSSNKLKGKKNFPVGSAIKSASSKHNSLVKSEKGKQV